MFLFRKRIFFQHAGCFVRFGCGRNRSVINYDRLSPNRKFGSIEHWWEFVFYENLRTSLIESFLLVAISYNTIPKHLDGEVQAAGLHLNAPGFRFIKFPSVFTSMEFDDISVWEDFHWVFDRNARIFSVWIKMVYRLIWMSLCNFKRIQNICTILFYNLKILMDIKRFFMLLVELRFMTLAHSKFPMVERRKYSFLILVLIRQPFKVCVAIFKWNYLK